MEFFFKRGKKNKSLAEQEKTRRNMKVKNKNVMQQMAGRTVSVTKETRTRTCQKSIKFEFQSEKEGKNIIACAN
jgi:hypothetical protein